MHETLPKASSIDFYSLQRPEIDMLMPLENKSKFPKWGSLHRKVMAKSAVPITYEQKSRLEGLLRAANTDYLAEPDSDRLFIMGTNGHGRPALLRPVESIAKNARAFVPGKPRQSRNVLAEQSKGVRHG